jgi:hypothetical protein
MSDKNNKINLNEIIDLMLQKIEEILYLDEKLNSSDVVRELIKILEKEYGMEL